MIEIKIDQLFSEKNLAEALGISKSSLYALRRKGAPWVSLGGKAFYYEPEFMAWLISHQRRYSGMHQDNTTEDHSTPGVSPQEV